MRAGKVRGAIGGAFVAHGYHMRPCDTINIIASLRGRRLRWRRKALGAWRMAVGGVHGGWLSVACMADGCRWRVWRRTEASAQLRA